jgi:hypothetical protein
LWVLLVLDHDAFSGSMPDGLLDGCLQPFIGSDGHGSS